MATVLLISFFFVSNAMMTVKNDTPEIIASKAKIKETDWFAHIKPEKKEEVLQEFSEYLEQLNNLEGFYKNMPSCENTKITVYKEDGYDTYSIKKGDNSCYVSVVQDGKVNNCDIDLGQARNTSKKMLNWINKERRNTLALATKKSAPLFSCNERLKP